MAISSTRPAFFLACALFLAACNSSSPVPDSIFLTGNVTYQGSNWHSLPLTDSGIVEINVLSLEPELIEIIEGIELDLFLGLGIGRPSGDDCTPTTRSAIREGDRLVYGLQAQEYCILLFDTGSLPEDATVRYALEVISDE